MKLAIFAAFIFTLAAQSRAGDAVLKNEDDAETLAEKALTSVVAGKYDDAFNTLKPYWQVPESEVDNAVLQTTKQRGLAEKRYGKSVDYKFVSRRFASDCLLCFNYIERCEHAPMVWQFLFYKVGAGWHLTAVSWNDKVALVFNQQ